MLRKNIWRQLTILIVLVHVAQTQQSKSTQFNDSQKLKVQYIQDLINLADYIKQQPQKIVNLSKMPTNINNVLIQSIQSFQQKKIQLLKNQQAELSYPFLQYLSDIKIKESIVTQQIKTKFPESRRHYQVEPLDYSNLSICKIQDPQIKSEILFSIQMVLNQSTSYQGKNNYVIKLNQKEYYQLYVLNGLFIQVYKIEALAQKNKATINLLHKISLQQLIVPDKQQIKKIFLFQLQKNVFVTNGLSLYFINEGKLQFYAQFKYQTLKKTTEQIVDKIVQIIPMKHAILIQYETSFGIFVESLYLPNSFNDMLSSTRKMINLINQTSLYKFTKQKMIREIQVVVDSLILERKELTSVWISNILAYLINRQKLMDLGVIELVYGSYGQINIYPVPYGNLKRLKVFGSNLQILFQQVHNKQSKTYIAEMYLNKTNRVEPQLMINRFYHNQRKTTNVQYWDGQLYFIDSQFITIQGPAINSNILISQNISQFPYRIALPNTKFFQFLERYSTPLTDLYVSYNQNYLQIIKTKRENQKIVCKHNKDFDLRVQMIGSCCRKQFQCESQQIWKLCKYQHNIRVLMINQSSNKIFSMIRYLIFILIVMSIVAFLLIINNIKKNTKVLLKLSEIKKKFQDKFRQMKANHNNKQIKGQKIDKDEQSANRNEFMLKQNSCKQQQKNSQMSQRQNQNKLQFKAQNLEQADIKNVDSQIQFKSQ